MTADAKLLESIQLPADLRRLPATSLAPLAEELRTFLVRKVAGSGGHLAAGLGTVELAIALHFVFETPRDVLIWDVGHQAYPHKVLTGRRERLSTIRRRDGLSGFLRREESKFDAFGAGHSSTSISAAVGSAVAAQLAARTHSTVAIIGDGGLTAGLAYEALQHAGSMANLDLIVVLNDNGMSISPNVGALSASLGLADAGRLFEQLGWSYEGPCDGHDVDGLVARLSAMRARRGPRVLHVKTVKGYGYEPAARDPVRYHGVTPFDPAVGIVPSSTRSNPTYTDVFGQWLCETAARDARVAAITPAMREGSGLVQFAQQFPRRYFDVGIAEQHCVTYAAGLACDGQRPVVAVYSTFLQRAYDQVVHDVALQKLPVLFAIDRAGLVGPDGATHNGAFDLPMLRCVPDMIVMTPSDGNELRDMLATGLQSGLPAAVRYPRAPVPTQVSDRAPAALPIGKAEIRRIGTRVAILAFGTMLATALEAADAVDATVANMRFVKPLDHGMVADLARRHELLVTIEEGSIAGGAGSAVNECLAARDIQVRVLNLGLPDRFIEHGSRAEALHEAGLDLDGVLREISARLAHPRGTSRRDRLTLRPRVREEALPDSAAARQIVTS
jgi:1-deoxy-D-xylulose-5-phosphate synthase